jgi:hypothetical protein
VSAIGPPSVAALTRSVVRAGAPRPWTARRAARDFQQPLGRAVAAEVRWLFAPPRTCLLGVLTNLFLAALWLAVQPVTRHGPHDDLVVLVDTYFASFVLADVTTTNMLGADHYRVRAALDAGTPVWRILLAKNVALAIVVGIPTFLAAAAFTVTLDHPGRLLRTLPNVAVPILSWLGVGNLVSVILPVAALPLLRRWRQRHDRRRLALWAMALVLPYALYYVADPLGGVEHRWFWNTLPNVVGPILGRDTKSYVHLGVAAAVWLGGLAAATLWARRRGLHLR